MFAKTVTVVTLYLLGMVLPSEAQAKTSASDWPNCDDGLLCTQTSYPQERYTRLMADYHHQVKIAFPDENGGRIWVKGDKERQIVTIKSEAGHIVGATAALSSPFYTALIGGLPFSEALTVVISSPGGDTKEIQVPPLNDPATLNRQSRYSIAFYGCFQPFTVTGPANAPAPNIYQLGTGFPVDFMNLFSSAALGHPTPAHSPILPGTVLIVGTGDQVYMDAGYENTKATRTNKHPLSAWTTNEPQPKLLRTAGDMKEHVKSTYRAFGAFPAMNEVFQSVYQVNAWDDHEIRDGWGSQGDEYIDDELNPRLAAAYELARDGYINHQYLMGPNQPTTTGDTTGGDTLAHPASLHQQFTMGDVQGFVLDLRTNRISADNQGASIDQVLGEDQKKAFENWVEGLAEDQLALIVSSMPVFLKNNEIVERVIAGVKPSLRDDLKDAWASNTAERDWLIKTVLAARLAKNIKPVFVSGDYHKGALSEIWMGDEEAGACTKSGERKKTIFGYEMIASGLFHEGIAKGMPAKGFDRAEAQRVGQHFIKELSVEVGGKETTYCLDPHVEKSIVAENFGGLVLQPDSQSKDSLRLIAGREARIRENKKKDDNHENKAEVFEMVLDWDKNFDPLAEKCYRGFWQVTSRIFRFLPWVDDKFTPLGTSKIDEFVIPGDAT